jgi:hypothetical protein
VATPANWSPAGTPTASSSPCRAIGPPRERNRPLRLSRPLHPSRQHRRFLIVAAAVTSESAPYVHPDVTRALRNWRAAVFDFDVTNAAVLQSLSYGADDWIDAAAARLDRATGALGDAQDALFRAVKEHPASVRGYRLQPSGYFDDLDDLGENPGEVVLDDCAD